VGHDVINRMAEAVSSVLRMREFRRYVADTAGRRLIQLWMDIERFHRIDPEDERSRWLLYREIQITFYEFHEAPPPTARNPRADHHDVNCVLVGTRSEILTDLLTVFIFQYSCNLQLSCSCIDIKGKEYSRTS